jgi:hypothetical protein
MMEAKKSTGEERWRSKEILRRGKKKRGKFDKGWKKLTKDAIWIDDQIEGLKMDNLNLSD